jgi:ribonuclease-3
MASTDAVEERIGRKFRERALLIEALTHASASERSRKDYERLEFLGDRVLGLVIAEHLFNTFPNESEDALAPRLNALVNRDACARAAKRVDLGDSLILSHSESKSGGRQKETILADACEALIAAVYLDGGMEAARDFIILAWAEEFGSTDEAPKDPKTALQEWAAQRRRPNPAYDVVARSGPDHAPHFIVEAKVEGLDPLRGEGGSKRDAERAAARALLASVGIHV